MDLPLELPDECPTFDGVRLRAFRDTDVPMLLDLSTDPYVPATGSLPANATPEEALAYIERQRDRLVTGAGYSFCAAVEAPTRRSVRRGCGCVPSTRAGPLPGITWRQRREDTGLLPGP